jgi:hypothetical protein
MAIKAGAKQVHESDPSRQIYDVVRQVYYDRFLCRVFAAGEESDWVLKGGSGMLARVPNARRTLDADLYLSGYSIDKALAELKRLATHDLRDYFRFVYREYHAILENDSQPYADGYRVIFDAYLGTKLVDAIKIDLSTSVDTTEGTVFSEPANRVPLAKLRSFPYRLYPIPNQIADKVSATAADYAGRPSSREKDLVDLVVIALTQQVEASGQRRHHPRKPAAAPAAPHCVHDPQRLGSLLSEASCGHSGRAL